MLLVSLCSLVLEENLTFKAVFWYYSQINSTHSSTRKTPQRRTLQIALRQLEKPTSSRATVVVYVELRRQCPPLTFRPMPASNGP